MDTKITTSIFKIHITIFAAPSVMMTKFGIMVAVMKVKR